MTPRNAAAPDADDVEGGATTKVHEEREATTYDTALRPFADGADAVMRSGLGSPLPVPYGKKSAPPTGYTGAGGIRPSGPDVEEWKANRGGDNIAIRLADDVIGIDVDDYDGKAGARTLTSFEEKHGELAATSRPTSRDDGVSGIRLHRLPEGVDESELGDMGPGVEVIRAGHRYVMAGGSLHPEGRVYEYVAQDGTRSLTPPSKDDLPMLSTGQVNGLRKKAKMQTTGASSVGIEGLTATLEAHPELVRRLTAWLPTPDLFERDCLKVAQTEKEEVTDLGNGVRGTWETGGSGSGLVPYLAARALRLDTTREALGLEPAYADIFRALFDEAERGLGKKKLNSDAKYAAEKGPQLPSAWEDWTNTERVKAQLESAAMKPAQTTAHRVNTETVLSEPEAAPKQTNAELVAARALAEYSLGVTPEGEPFAVECNGTGLAIPLGAKGDGLRGRIAAAIYDETGRVIGNEALGSGLGIVIAKAKASGTVTPMHLRVAHDPNQIVLDLGQPNSARCVVITPGGWTVEDRPPAGILFRRTGTSRPLPTPVRGGKLDVLRDLLDFVADDPRWLLIRGWLPASLRCNSPRPLLLMLGAAGSGKTIRGHLIVNVLDPRPELGSSFGRNLDDDRTKAFNSFQLGYDNLTSISEQTSDQVCRTVTGDAAEKRRNYTDTDVVVMPYRRTGVMTAINAPALRPDALERIIPISLSAMPQGARRSEEHLWSTFDDAHPGILGAVLDDAVTMLAGLPEVIERNDGPRMLDYWQSLLSIDPVLAQAYADNAADVLTIAAEDDPLVVTVRAWLRAFPRSEREGEPAEEFASLDHFARGQTHGVPAWWPPTHRSMSAHLTKATNTLAAVGVTFERGKSNGRRTWHFVLDEEQGR